MRNRFLTASLAMLLAGGVASAQTTARTDTTRSQTEMNKTKTTQPKTQPSATSVEDVNVFFSTDSASLRPGADQELAALADWARCDSRNAIILEGHADPRGTQNHNLVLSGRRAGAVRERLIAMGVPSQRIVVTLFGKNGKPEKTYAKDRRVTARATNAPVEPTDLTAG